MKRILKAIFTKRNLNLTLAGMCLWTLLSMVHDGNGVAFYASLILGAMLISIASHAAQLATWEMELNERASKIADLESGKITINQLMLKEGNITAAFGTELAQVMASAFLKLVDDGNATNYLEILMRHNDGREVIVTICRSKGQTPHALRMQAEAEIKELKAKLAIGSTI